MEWKSRTAPPEAPYSHRVQVWAYCLLLEDVTGFPPPYGVVRYSDGAEFRLDWDEDARREVLRLRRQIARPYDGAADPSPSKCARCPWRPGCDAPGPAARSVNAPGQVDLGPVGEDDRPMLPGVGVGLENSRTERPMRARSSADCIAMKLTETARSTTWSTVSVWANSNVAFSRGANSGCWRNDARQPSSFESGVPCGRDAFRSAPNRATHGTDSSRRFQTRPGRPGGAGRG